MQYHVEIAGETVWSGEGVDDDAIPPEYHLTRPPDGTPAYHLFRDGQEFTVIKSLAECLDPDSAPT